MPCWEIDLPHRKTRYKQQNGKQTHGSGRILKSGPCSIKASLGPSSLEEPTPLCPPPSDLSDQPSCPVDILPLLLPLLLLVYSGAASSLLFLPLCCSAAPPCQHHSTRLPPPFIIPARISLWLQLTAWEPQQRETGERHGSVRVSLGDRSQSVPLLPCHVISLHPIGADCERRRKKLLIMYNAVEPMHRWGGIKRWTAKAERPGRGHILPEC